jgi:hypothetical protein
MWRRCVDCGARTWRSRDGFPGRLEYLAALFELGAISARKGGDRSPPRSTGYGLPRRAHRMELSDHFHPQSASPPPGVAQAALRALRHRETGSQRVLPNDRPTERRTATQPGADAGRAQRNPSHPARQRGAERRVKNGASIKDGARTTERPKGRVASLRGRRQGAASRLPAVRACRPPDQHPLRTESSRNGVAFGQSQVPGRGVEGSVMRSSVNTWRLRPLGAAPPPP